MGRYPKRQELTDEQRTQAVHAVLIDGELAEVVARRIGRTTQTMKWWIKAWFRRLDIWRGQPLEQKEIAAGYVLEGDQYGHVYVHREQPRPPRQPDPVRDFTYTVLLPRIETRAEIEKLWSEFGDDVKARFGPAFDLYLQAAELAEHAQQLRGRAVELVMAETPSQKQAA